MVKKFGVSSMQDFVTPFITKPPKAESPNLLKPPLIWIPPLYLFNILNKLEVQKNIRDNLKKGV